MNFKGNKGVGFFRFGTQRIAQHLLVVAFLGAPVVASAAVPSSEELDQRIRILERQLEIQKEEADAKSRDATSTRIDDKGVSIKKGDFELKIKGVVHADLRTFLDDRDEPINITAASNNAALSGRNGSSDGFLFRRIRPSLEGSFGKLLGFRLTPEFAGAGDAETTSLVDAYVDLKFDPAATLRIGKVKGPVSLERLQSAANFAFIERSFTAELAPNRDLGAQFQGELLGSRLSYTLGIYDGTADGRNASLNGDNRFEYAARLFAEPFKDGAGALSGLGFGIAGTVGSKDQVVTTDASTSVRSQGRSDHVNNYSAQANGVLPRYRTPGQNTFFSYRGAEFSSVVTEPTPGTFTTTNTITRTGVYADGDHVRIAPQAYWYWNSVGLLGEYISSEQELGLNGYEDEFENTAWALTATYVLTGEDASYRGIQKLAAPFQLGGPGWGAVELAARYGELEIDEDTFEQRAAVAGTAFTATSFADPGASAQKARAWTVGVNWYLTGNTKLLVNYTQTGFDGGAPAVSGTTTTANARDRIDEKAVFARVQLAF